MPLRVLAVLHSAELYGAQRSFLDLARHAKRDELEFVVALPSRGPTTALLEEMQIPFEITGHRLWVPTRNSVSRSYWVRYAFAAAMAQRRLRALIKRTEPNVVYTNTVTVLDGALAARFASIPHVWHLREAIRGNRHLRSALPQRFVWRVVRGLSTRVVFNSRFLERSYGGTDCSKSSVVYNGIELSKQRRASSPAKSSLGPRSIVCVGYMDRPKGLDVLLDAALLLVGRGLDFRVVVAGNLSREYQVREIEPRLADSRLHGRVVLLGWCADMAAVYGGADVVVSSSRQESFGRTILEAMACGLPVVSTRSGGPEEVVIDHETGLLVPVDDSSALAAALEHVLVDRDLARRLGEAGRRVAGERFSMEAMTTALTRVLQGAAGGDSTLDGSQSSPDSTS
jgi:glycosyltransferase involved in cell wall biosynthesis